MKVISGLGGSATTFVIDTLDRRGSRKLFGILDLLNVKRSRNLSPRVFRNLRYILLSAGLHITDLHVLRRPDRFWTDWVYNPSGRYAPDDPQIQSALAAQRDYLVRTAKTRSAGLPIRESDLTASSLANLVGSYLARLEEIERGRPGTIVLVCGHWGGFGILRELEIDTVYLIRDPFNSIVSHSKPIRHQKDYLRRGLTTVDSEEWVNNYLDGPHHRWIRHAEFALEQTNATIVRYHEFAADWQKVEGLPDISDDFEYRQNHVGEFLSPATIDYIYDRTRKICDALGFDRIYDDIRSSLDAGGVR